MNYKLAFGAVFRRLRHQRGLTQEQFEPAATARYVRNLEKGEYSPSLSTFRALCDVLEVSPVTLACLVEAEFIGGEARLLLNEAAKELREVDE
ncbi:helix-turn-helix transcriptional regulator [Pseudomonas sp. BN505]|uniref:Helix-turn-helix transcriptional regulator n=1 Tax=Pseudomonas machongensis TaxID=3110229 RepID=A0ABU5VEH2_9PSED|nr:MULTISPECIES: helix-turn-helix transcriptional regulator [Pseudomonas]MDH4843007.1 helix-turn-helix transcriptional regulator [Pseudomonas sp. BN605]MDH4845093.1 helix-turn-helix transcriptional regulator [Pseudomonas sp. BN605]MDH4845801.1 helix-turn-helix transcriptional regulator [Pseudomonas sp. BN605]MDH4855709.1 helix-turn-helix transcriptional regulator [Pseudomonas sp. BN505]MEA5671731.1 helix-turn-helix transcriptional regulator [Pseudomonas sp. MH2]